jgi:hypothetical protein
VYVGVPVALNDCAEEVKWSPHALLPIAPTALSADILL